MKIEGWDCITGFGGSSRAATHPENGSFVWVDGRLTGAGDCPRLVVAWLLRPQLKDSWYTALRCAEFVGSTHLARQGCPFDGEPPSSDNDPS